MREVLTSCSSRRCDRTPNMGLVAFLACWLFLPLFMLFDVYYFIRGLVRLLQHKLVGSGMNVPIERENVTHGICTTTDMDFSWHMNNSRYLRECDFARFSLWMDSGVWNAVQQLKGFVTLGGSTIRYRKSLQLFDRYIIRSKILCWDDKAFYVEQRIERASDNFVCAIVLCKQVFVKATPTMLLKHIHGQDIESPEFPPEVKKWTEYEKLSSEKLRNEREETGESKDK